MGRDKAKSKGKRKSGKGKGKTTAATTTGGSQAKVISTTLTTSGIGHRHHNGQNTVAIAMLYVLSPQIIATCLTTWMISALNGKL